MGRRRLVLLIMSDLILGTASQILRTYALLSDLVDSDLR
jgi:hypothetical protein